ncbi:IS110 family transposase [Cetobacterium sp.]|uniref:IS110 family transposase n=1 Tax=Cetobacterium sp. TaxID=2071632 RepID=UPI003EE5739E
MVGLKPKGQYWKTFATLLEANNIKVVIVNPYYTKRTKELDDNSETKNDKKDALTISKLVKVGRYSEMYLPKEEYAELRNLSNRRPFYEYL